MISHLTIRQYYDKCPRLGSRFYGNPKVQTIISFVAHTSVEIGVRVNITVVIYFKSTWASDTSQPRIPASVDIILSESAF